MLTQSVGLFSVCVVSHMVTQSYVYIQTLIDGESTSLVHITCLFLVLSPRPRALGDLPQTWLVFL